MTLPILFGVKARVRTSDVPTIDDESLEILAGYTDCNVISKQEQFQAAYLPYT